MQVGSLIAFLSYFMQILMAVLLATFMLVLLPRASVCAERISEVLPRRQASPAPNTRCVPSPSTARSVWKGRHSAIPVLTVLCCKMFR